jgi:hypothetical protein
LFKVLEAISSKLDTIIDQNEEGISKRETNDHRLVEKEIELIEHKIKFLSE